MRPLHAFGSWIFLIVLALQACQRTTPPANTPAGNLSTSNSLPQADNDSPEHDRVAADSDGQHESARDTTRHSNRLAGETSPYLLLHAHNPVNWYPWSDEALTRAAESNKVIFLSVGYSSCHWCHVMERESFMDEEIAAFLNRHFVCIKVDREERPDVDSVYMTAVQMISGRGGWPMSVFLTPEAKPFFGGTYFPARDGDRPGATGFLTLLQRIHEIWGERRDAVQQDAEKLTGLVRRELDAAVPQQDQEINAEVLDQIESALATQYDAEFGGFGFSPANPHMPKFPEPSNLWFLLDRAAQQPESERARKMLLVTLQHMADGGIYDHVGGGFHRYSTDRYWLIPHFEKMLYDNGQLLSVYARAFALTQNERFRRVAEQIVASVVREFRAPQGGFYSALDAESEGEEGRYYAWDRSEIDEYLPGPSMSLARTYYGLDGDANFEGRYVLHAADRSAETSVDATQQKLHEQIDQARNLLLQYRSGRVAPLLDTKILTAWNGLMIRGLADAGRLLERPDFVQLAADAADFVYAELRDGNGRLYRTHTAGTARLNAYLDDYAFFIDGLIGLHEATDDVRWLERAEQIMRIQIDLFADTDRGGFFFTARDHEQLIARGKQFVDGARPAGNSLSADNLFYLAAQLDKDQYRDLAEATVRAAGQIWSQNPLALPRMASVVQRHMMP